MSYEPWYQAQSPSKADVINSVNKSEFISNLNKEENTEFENIKLNQYANDLMQTLDRPIINITYDDIRSIWKWSELRDEIINDDGTMVQVALTDFETYFERSICFTAEDGAGADSGPLCSNFSMESDAGAAPLGYKKFKA